jgi:nitrite reductase/ring-hydroxylating ferredoxin subunit
VGFVLDVVGAEEQADAAMTIGALAAVPTALAGAADWAETYGGERRVGLVHALLNTLGLSCIIASLFARRNDNRALGVGLSTAGLSVASFSAWLGGSLVYVRGVGVSHNAFEPAVDDFQPVSSADGLEPGKLTYAELSTEGGRVPLLLYKSGSSIYALSDVCSHAGGPLHEGKVVDGECVECPWHGSQFRLTDGLVRQGPATVPQPLFETRIRNGQVEVRRVR